MPEINYKDLKKYVSGLDKTAFSTVYLLYGEEYLYKTAFESILDIMVPQSKRSLNYEPVDSDSESISDVIERLNTFSMMPGLKVVSLCDTKIFHSKKEEVAILKKTRTAFENGDKKKAAKHLTSLLSVTGLSFDDIATEKGKKTVKYTEAFSDEGKWLDELAGYCHGNGIEIPASGDSSKILKEAIEKGIPDDHHLIITTDIVDKRKGLFTSIKKNGVIIDCSVPKGDRKADKDQQNAVLRENMNLILAKSGKKMDQDAYAYICEITGFDLRTFTGNLEKLISYSGKRDRITREDAKSVLKRTKQDPIYELSGAVAERHLDNALFFTSALLANSIYPLQILATMVNLVRRLLIAKDFILALRGGVWRGNMDFSNFKTHIMPLIKEFDKNIKDRIEQREHQLSQIVSSEKKGKNKKSLTDLILAKNPNSPYPVFLLLKNSNRYTMNELTEALENLSLADHRLKSTGENPRLVLEDAIIRICRTKVK